MSDENLWGDIKAGDKVVTPRNILDEQAAILTKATGEVLIGRVGVAQGPQGSTQVLLALRISAPLLGNYSYEVCNVIHDIALYPLRVVDSAENFNYECKDAAAFKAALKAIFQKPRTKMVIRSLISQS